MGQLCKRVFVSGDPASPVPETRRNRRRNRREAASAWPPLAGRNLPRNPRARSAMVQKRPPPPIWFVFDLLRKKGLVKEAAHRFDHPIQFTLTEKCVHGQA